MKSPFLYLSIVLFILSATNIFGQSDAKSKSIIDKMIAVTGDYDKLKSKKDVQFDYVYDNFDAGKDVSKERLIFDGEQSWAMYRVHQRNVLPTQEGIVEQSLINGEPLMTLNGKFVVNKEALGSTKFIREVNPFWFSMIYKLQDNGAICTYMGTEQVNGITYEKVSLTYDGGVTKKEADDEYILYFNNKTHLLDLFYFSLPAFGVNQPILKMTMSYEIIDGIYIPTVRKSYAPTQDGTYQLNGQYTFKNITFGNGFTTADIRVTEK